MVSVIATISRRMAHSGTPIQPFPNALASDQHSTETNDDALFNLDLLHLKPEHRVWFGVVNLAVRNFMNGLDPSHTYQYTRRLVSNAIRILDKEKKHHEWARRIDPVIIWVACMTSAVGASEHETDNWDYDQIDIIDDFLKPLGCPLHIRRQAAHLAARVSATAKSSNQDDMDAFAREYPPFRVIHDARRLDELGAIGMSRLILNHDMSESPRWAVIQSNVRLLEDRFAHYSRLMLTDSGRKMAEQRYKWMVEGFLGQWKRETDTSNV
ncbi:uncharacterized protein SETTUDRAFT_27395 [Exserohilum turcica Et28A]|uniref:Uncharacterized protein n=1 Tax=Exserohilum turcicum (strain 28A) TaxID=671987 RepID=R0IVG8_EXST2|nr:uncharacterized protein SETTUDRAFT_27395 [Exserohilum turcica Et28A]EOA88591.1 hypothetical protein SETTUDRAFT_27395 [Exserohilum turcica Et28A]